MLFSSFKLFETKFAIYSFCPHSYFHFKKVEFRNDNSMKLTQRNKSEKKNVAKINDSHFNWPISGEISKDKLNLGSYLFNKNVRALKLPNIKLSFLARFSTNCFIDFFFAPKIDQMKVDKLKHQREYEVVRFISNDLIYFDWFCIDESLSYQMMCVRDREPVIKCSCLLLLLLLKLSIKWDTISIDVSITYHMTASMQINFTWDFILT